MLRVDPYLLPRGAVNMALPQWLLLLEYPYSISTINNGKHLFREGDHLYQEFSKAKIPDASFFAPEDMVTSSSDILDPMKCPKFLVNKQATLSDNLMSRRAQAVKDHKQRHDRICRKYATEVISKVMRKFGSGGKVA